MSDDKVKAPRTVLLHEGGADYRTTLGAIRQWLNQADVLGYEDDRPVLLNMGAISVGDASDRLYADPNPDA